MLVTISLDGFVAGEMQNNLESAHICDIILYVCVYIYIYI